MKKLMIGFMMMLALVLAGCGTLEVKLEKDGSGEALYKIPEDESYYTLTEIENEFENMVESTNGEYDDEVLKLKKIKAKDGVISVEIAFKDFSALVSSGSMLVSVEDMLRYEPSQLENLESPEGEAIELGSKDVKGYTYLSIAGNDAYETIIKLPGDVKYMSSGVELLEGKKDTIITEDGSFSVVYEEGGSIGGFIISAIIVIVIVLVGIFFFRRNKARKIGPTTIEGGTSQDA